MRGASLFHPLTGEGCKGSSLRAWGPPIPLSGLGADHIDTTVVKVGSTYHAFTKNETKKVVQHAVSSSLYGPYRFISPGDWGTFVEGPAVIREDLSTTIVLPEQTALVGRCGELIIERKTK